MKEYATPDKNNPHNYMLDTCACSHIFSCQDSTNIVKKSLELGFQYYTTAIQDLEFDGEGSRTYDENCISTNSRTLKWLPLCEIIPVWMAQLFLEILKVLHLNYTRTSTIKISQIPQNLLNIPMMPSSPIQP